MSHYENSHEGTLWLDRASHPWQRWFPTWRGVGVGRFKCARSACRTDSQCGMESSREPLMVSSRCGLNSFKVGVCEEP